MEKIETKDVLEMDKYDQYASEWRELSELKSFCSDWVITHYWEMFDKEKLSPEQARLHDIAKVLHEYMRGNDPFIELKNDKSPQAFDLFTLRVGAMLFTHNKKKVSDFFNLADDGKTLNSSIASRAEQFCSDEQLRGLSTAAKANLILEVIEKNRSLRKSIMTTFYMAFTELLYQKQQHDVTFQNYSFRQWVRMASIKG
ncbi:hypothetical protein F9817_13620 [Vibrio sp. CAIM 722]|uniref:Uncharacterized protein n=1 Tax=Vibrio eleionomae TaxID=2653505 RepID=A0A7X4LLM3_9VIBR|nr:hypothetical protein [Vibrio eleionomae]MZI94233.1 hypothetical protein [Vibrio eleionomae]